MPAATPWTMGNSRCNTKTLRKQRRVFPISERITERRKRDLLMSRALVPARVRRIANPPQVDNLPHKEIVASSGGFYDGEHRLRSYRDKTNSWQAAANGSPDSGQPANTERLGYHGAISFMAVS